MIVLDLSNAGSTNVEARYAVKGMAILPLPGGEGRGEGERKLYSTEIVEEPDH